MKRPNIALVGCGAIARIFYLPALARRQNDFERIWLVDPSAHARHAAADILKSEQANSLSEVQDQLEFVVVTAPNAFHFTLTQTALERGAHVLVEKPFAIWPNEGAELVALGERLGRLVLVNQTRRFFPYIEHLRERIAAGDFGALRSVVHREGEKLAWPFESGAAFARGQNRTGVIMDLGVHILDTYYHLLGAQWTFVSSVHDGFDGPEGLADIRLEANGAEVVIKISRFQKQANIGRLYFDEADIEFGSYDLNSCDVVSKSGARTTISASSPVESYNALADRVLDNLVAVARGQAQPTCSGASSLPVIAMLDEIYRRAERYPAALGAI